MDFNLTREQEMVKYMVREFAQKELAPRIPEFDQPEGEWPFDVMRRMGELGLIGLVIPKEYGGNAMGHIAQMAAFEEIARVYPAWASHLRGFQLASYAISHYGPEDIRQKYVPRLVRGEIQGCMALTEAVGGSDLASIQTTAEKEDSHYIINGRKIMQSRYNVVDFFLAITKTGERSYTFFLVDRDTPGVELGRREEYISCTTRTSPIGEVIFNNVRVPLENIIGVEGKGFAPVLGTVGAVGRTGGAGISLGIAEAAYELSLKYAKERHLYGKPITDLQTIRWWLTEMDTQIEAAKYFCYYCAWLLDQGKRPGEIMKEIARAKVYASETSLNVCLKAIEIHGAYGTSPEFGVIQKMKSALDQIAAAGSNQVMRRTIADAIIG
ncbi:acyl-CoA dehydrogenase family protein [Chloroflexota bacterium]